ncbi:hypothetical protein F4560_000954 [Saccharothrix ecbatanensis]|uniref:DUF4342 domain-containing protein n=1 Tax=Saccharothrix ecbatanensis TaxID=1105145 RepID=A0A7W9HFV1_9PSEU|nr:DUF4342 domain-containing protein [Saccharothrix ecbatanensis]MBB5801186.1 hypothetical protein [Saccharothrix ecbatanensis]
MTTKQQERAYTAQVTGQAIVDKAAELAHEAGDRYVVVRDDDGHPVVEVPVIAGVVVGALAPIVTSVAAIAALWCGWTITVERHQDRKGAPS